MTATGTKIKSQSRMGNLPKGTALYYYYAPDSAMLPAYAKRKTAWRLRSDRMLAFEAP
jgi:hypothetical protein